MYLGNMEKLYNIAVKEIEKDFLKEHGEICFDKGSFTKDEIVLVFILKKWAKKFLNWIEQVPSEQDVIDNMKYVILNEYTSLSPRERSGLRHAAEKEIKTGQRPERGKINEKIHD